MRPAPVVGGRGVVGHDAVRRDEHASARRSHAAELGDGLGGVVAVLEHLVAEHDVEGPVLDGKVLDRTPSAPPAGCRPGRRRRRTRHTARRAARTAWRRSRRRARGIGRSRRAHRLPARAASARAARARRTSASSAVGRGAGQTSRSCAATIAPAAARPSSRQVAACSGIPATIPSDAHSPASVRSAQTTSEAGPGRPRRRSARSRAPGQHEPGRPDEEEQREPDHSCVREHLDVEVLDAPLAPFRREREIDDVGEALARVRDVRLEDLGP